MKDPAMLSRKTTIHDPRRTIQAGKRQLVIKFPSSPWRALPGRQDVFHFIGKGVQMSSRSLVFSKARALYFSGNSVYPGKSQFTWSLTTQI
jgi:hypothetical protein